ncbi:MAG: DEAD/DEAH box helicase family protein [Elusimicrobiota bacterium]
MSDEISGPDDNAKYEGEIAKIDSKIAALAELKQQYLKQLSAAKGTKSMPARSPILSVDEKLSLFLSRFQGRTDVYAKRWENRAGRSGYSPVCKNEWDRLLCRKPEKKCADCDNRDYLPLDSSVAARHLAGQIVAGIYPLLRNDHCRFLAIDFDGDNWADDAAAIRKTCMIDGVPAAVERSRSGNGAHVWVFFQEEVPANLARRLGTALIAKTMSERCQLAIKSFDRLFPNQDSMPKGGFGNLIALPFQKAAAVSGNSVFIDEAGNPYADQWEYLASVKPLSLGEVETLMSGLEKSGGKIPARWSPIDEGDEPWTRPPSGRRNFNIDIKTLPPEISAVLSNRIFIKTDGVPSALLNQLRYLAAFHNPDFYKKQKMHFSTHATPRIICCAEMDSGWLSMPRGCLEDIKGVLTDYEIKLNLEDKRFNGIKTEFNFLGSLYPPQQAALEDILSSDFGVLSAPAGSGKTVIGAAAIARRNTSALVLVNRKPLMEQWRLQLSVLLGLDKKEVGLIGGGKNAPTGIIDVGMVQSLDLGTGVDDRVANYGFVIMDECHHTGAESFEKVLGQAKAKYILGLTATPYRRDGHQPIIHMQCGQIVHRILDKDSIACAPNSKVIVRTTDFAAEWNDDSKIQELWPKLTADCGRNRQILKDVEEVLSAGRFPLILTERREHLVALEVLLKDKTDFLAVLYGGLKQKRRHEIFEELKHFPDNCRKAILATGSYVGEGFDEPRLDTLFLTMPASFKGKIVQYTGRLHRRHTNKTEVQVYDYLDSKVSVLANMHKKRLKTYKMLGYTVTTGDDQLLPGI